jgi:hypothetical protein
MNRAQTPSCFTPLAELKVDWPRVLKRLRPRYRGILLPLNKQHLQAMSSSFKYPVVAIPHEDYIELNKNVRLLAEIAGAINYQNVHRFSGVTFIAPMSPEEQELIDKIIETFDAEVIDVEYSVSTS